MEILTYHHHHQQVPLLVLHHLLLSLVHLLVLANHCAIFVVSLPKTHTYVQKYDTFLENGVRLDFIHPCDKTVKDMSTIPI